VAARLVDGHRSGVRRKSFGKSRMRPPRRPVSTNSFRHSRSVMEPSPLERHDVTGQWNTLREIRTRTPAT